MRKSLAVMAIAPIALVASALVASSASAQTLNSPPGGAGTERAAGPAGGIREGVEASAGIGTGFADTYGLGFEGRIGYTFRSAIYAGADVQYFIGHTVNDEQAHAAFVGGQLGYKLFPTERIEIRPYVFAGPAFIRQVASGPASTPVITNSKTDFALQPGALVSYHFGNFFLGGDAHYMLIPSPNTLAVEATAGLGF